MENQRYLFRGKRLDNGQWVEGYYGWSMGRYYITWVHCVMPSLSDPGGEYFENTYEVEGETIGQVFQTNPPRLPQIAIGDIVKVRGTKRVGEYITEIVHAPNGGYTLKENKTYLNNDCVLASISEIVGNRWDNPELLQEPEKL